MVECSGVVDKEIYRRLAQVAKNFLSTGQSYNSIFDVSLFDVCELHTVSVIKDQRSPR